MEAKDVDEGDGAVRKKIKAVEDKKRGNKEVKER